MGVFRIILAFSVLIGHAGCNYGLGGMTAVQAFYIISGFYMTLILNEKYLPEKATRFTFYSNRALRLMPLYIFFLLVSGLISFSFRNSAYYHLQFNAAEYFIQFYDQIHVSTLFYLIFSNLFIIGHDISAFLGIDNNNGMLYFVSSWLKTSEPLVGGFFFIPQSWTLSLEFYFYLLAPFIVRRQKRYIVSLILASLLIRVYTYKAFADSINPLWLFGFFPSEFALFLLGSLSHRIFVFLGSRNYFNKMNLWIFTCLLFVITFFFRFLPKGNTVPFFFNDAQIIFYTLEVLSLPFLFHLTRSNKVDRFIGELSYPVYLSHLIVIPFFGAPFVPGKSIVQLISISIITVLISVFGVKFIQNRIDVYREWRLKS